ncbi:hypothetical protein BA768_05375 [Chryseobacterium sp. CBo1]|uniref:acyltransferase family protein n=1 Tax=Chryseobacterium sp. CBo1 TaxID=1869230 RepID=UPI0008104975|nr:acyltransferase [Chryseobacterium sp. CBo1]OCK50581.1 hypothetical protein BA768_05375 [Chryseobacterium sp. CBo1]
MKIDQLTFTRFVAAIAIVAYHFGRPLNIFSHPLVSKILTQANIGVSFFFILSGFVMIIAYGSKKNIDSYSYLKNRFSRIYPLYLFAILLMLILQTFDAKEDFVFSDLLLNVLMLQAWFPEKVFTVNLTGWSLSVEFLFYAIFPLMFNFFYQKYKLKQLVIPVFLIWLFTQIFLICAINGHWVIVNESITKKFLLYFPLMHINQFLAGNLAGLFFIQHLKNRSGNYDLIITLLFCLIPLALIFRPEYLNYHDGLLALIFIPLIIFISLNTGIITKIFSKKIFVFLGEISYGIYILQIPVFGFTEYALQRLRIFGDLKLFLCGVTALLFFSALSYLFIEKPLREKIKKINFSIR